MIPVASLLKVAHDEDISRLGLTRYYSPLNLPDYLRILKFEKISQLPEFNNIADRIYDIRLPMDNDRYIVICYNTRTKCICLTHRSYSHVFVNVEHKSDEEYIDYDLFITRVGLFSIIYKTYNVTHSDEFINMRNCSVTVEISDTEKNIEPMYETIKRSYPDFVYNTNVYLYVCYTNDTIHKCKNIDDLLTFVLSYAEKATIQVKTNNIQLSTDDEDIEFLRRCHEGNNRNRSFHFQRGRENERRVMFRKDRYEIMEQRVRRRRNMSPPSFSNKNIRCFSPPPPSFSNQNIRSVSPMLTPTPQIKRFFDCSSNSSSSSTLSPDSKFPDLDSI